MPSRLSRYLLALGVVGLLSAPLSGCSAGQLSGGLAAGGGDLPGDFTHDGPGYDSDFGVGGDRTVDGPPSDTPINPVDQGGPPPPDKGTPPPPDKGTPLPDQGPPPPLASHHFPSASIWYKDISNAPLDSRSSQIISGLNNAGGWGTGVMRIDFSNHILYANASTPFRTFTTTGDFYSPDCDHVQVPVPSGGAIEEENGYSCTKDGDCHLLVVHVPTKRLFEMWRANFSNASGVGGTFRGGCLAVWDLTKTYGPDGRGDQCTSADAAGYPMAPLLFTPDEVKAGVIAHAIRFILPNDRIQNGVYVHPATHSTPSTSGGSNTPPYGARLRLKASFNVGSLKAGAQVVARAMQKYGMFLADGGNIALTATSDKFTSAKWSGLLGSYDLQALKPTDFEMVDGGNRINYTGNCSRNGPAP